MAEYIDREAVLEFVEPDARPFLAERIKSIPAADVRPVVRGKWVTPTVIGGRAFNIPHCSACDGVPCGVDEHTNFCPNCGADMREKT